MQAKYKLLTNHSPLLENDNSSKLVPGYDPGHTLGTGDQEPHTKYPQDTLPSTEYLCPENQTAFSASKVVLICPNSAHISIPSTKFQRHSSAEIRALAVLHQETPTYRSKAPGSGPHKLAAPKGSGQARSPHK
ncbi:hypothetical protein DSO57_1017847 [Entomophthora muscae]|uniref:Uncharacterized protein n=1 Tax=Entomophthora muscae TaxID=34485 RepID=A0ACC2U2Z6_9FUNG|nr:hypothetical protein DSO57_1017847 [Entomophthora muscae]